LATALSWRHAYLLSVPLVLLFLIPSLLARFPGSIQPDSTQGNPVAPAMKKTSFFTALKTPTVWVFSVTLGLMVAVEMCSANWAGLYFRDVYGLDPRTSGANFISNFYILFTLSRLLSGFVIEKIGCLRSLFIAALVTVFIFILGFALGEKGIYVLPGLGFFTAVFWPIIMVTAIGYFRDDAPVFTSAIIVIAGTLNSAIQFLIGVTNRLAGPTWGYRSCLLYALLIIAALFVLRRYLRQPYRSACSI
jgi:fucose permease